MPDTDSPKIITESHNNPMFSSVAQSCLTLLLGKYYFYSSIVDPEG